MPEQLNIFIGYDSRESDLSDILAHSIKRRTSHDIKFTYLRHRELRKQGMFKRPWLIRSDDGENIDLIDNKPFSTEFSHTRFLIPALMNYQGVALFMDADMICLSDISKVFACIAPHQAIACVKHNHQPVANLQKMDGRLQNPYYRKNWSSFVLWNCAHAANLKLTPEKVNMMTGGDMHAFSWLPQHEIGELPKTYNYISGISPPLPFDGKKEKLPDVIHYTEGGPWFRECQDVKYADVWERELAHWRDEGEMRYA